MCLPGRLSPSGSMADPGVDLSFLTRRHAVKIDSRLSVETLSLAIGERIGHENVLSASRMNNVVVCFLKSVEMADEIVEHGIVVAGLFISALPLSMPSKKVMVSNIPPFISDDVLLETLSRYGKIVSPIRKIAIASKSPLLKHVVSFRRSVYMVCKDLDLKLNVKVEDFNYEIYVTTDTTLKCLGCGLPGHFRKDCPKNRKPTDNGSTSADNPSKTRDADTTDLASVAENRPEVVEAGRESDGIDIQVTINNGTGEQTEAAETSIVIHEAPTDSIALNEKDDASVIDSNADPDTETSQLSVSLPPVVCAEEDESLLLSDTTFKEPPKAIKRKSSRKNSNKAKKNVLVHYKSDVESESEASDCSVTCSFQLSGYPGQTYTVDDIKCFLVKTKNARHVRIDQYFPDVELFIKQTKNFMSQGSFEDTEVYRLKKILTKLNTVLNNVNVA